jgi:hypothetical protein
VASWRSCWRSSCFGGAEWGERMANLFPEVLDEKEVEPCTDLWH